jgi:hypothetical protein
MLDSNVRGRRIFAYRWGINPRRWDEPPTPKEALDLLRESARDLKEPKGGWGIGEGRRKPAGANLVRVGDLLIFYAGVKFGEQQGVYAIAEAGDGKSKRPLAVVYDRKDNEWRLPFRWCKASKILADSPFHGHSELFAPPGPAWTLLRLTSIPSSVRDLVVRALEGLPKNKLPVEPLTRSERIKIASPLKMLQELPAHEREIVRREIRQVVRNALFRRAVLETWFPDGDATCAACCKGIAAGDLYECEVAHIIDKWAKGKEQIRNGLPLCRTHHWAFDQELWGINPKTLKIVVRKKWLTNPLLNSIHGVKIVRPKPGSHIEALATKELSVRWKRFRRAALSP